jgi:hypothetical protein
MRSRKPRRICRRDWRYKGPGTHEYSFPDLPCVLVEARRFRAQSRQIDVNQHRRISTNRNRIVHRHKDEGVNAIRLFARQTTGKCAFTRAHSALRFSLSFLSVP